MPSDTEFPDTLPNSAQLRALAMERHGKQPRAQLTPRESVLAGFSLTLDLGDSKHPAITEVDLIFSAPVGKYMALAMMLDPHGPCSKALIPVCNLAKVLLGIVPESFVLDRLPEDSRNVLLAELER